ncbi:MAG: LuxR C-terminal-related transcriptional regulator [Caldilineaceae bacterium]
MPFPLLQTKLYVPPPRPQLVARPAITAKLQSSATYPLTLIAAPAGFGKTTLVSEWISQTDQMVAWLSLDEEDNDPGRFLLYLVTALRTVHPSIGEITLASLQAPQLPPITALLTPLLNDLHQLTEPLALVLDDYHLISAQPIHDAFIFLVEHLPASLRLIITTRIDPPLPLARWRVRARVAEVRADDLRFDATETATFFNGVMGLQLTPDDIARLEARTEGWIAGLQLAALSMQGRADVSGFIQSFSGSHRHVFSYLIEEVLNQRPAGTLDFLLQTAILERFNADLCNIVTGRSDSQALLVKLEQANLFLIPLDDERRWYRYHHLFAEVLHQRLQRSFPAAAVADLHLRASMWYEQTESIDEAIHHALAAQVFDRAATLVEQVASAMIQHSELARLLSWLEILPADEIRIRPLLGVYFAWGFFLSGQVELALVHLEAVEALLEADETKQTPEVRGHAAAMRAYLVRETGDLAATIILSRQALTHLPEQDSLLRAMVNLNLAIAHYLQGEFEPTFDLLTQTIATGQSPQRMANTLSAIYLNTQLLRGRGNLQQALQLCQQGLELVARHGWHDFPAVGFLYVALGDLLRERNDLSMAREYLEKGITLGQAGGHPHILIIGHVWLAWLRQTEGNVTGGQAAIQTALQFVQQYQVSRFWPLPSAACTQARLWIAQGNLAAANPWVQTSGLNESDPSIHYLDEAAYLTLARLRIAEGALAVAESLLLRLHQTAASAGRNGSLIEILILQAITHAAQQQREQAIAVLTQALRLAEPEGYVRLFVDEGEPIRFLIYDLRFTIYDPGLANYMDQLLAAFAQPTGQQSDTETATHLATTSPTIVNRKSQIVNLVEPLSERELEILHLVAAGLSNRQLADNLIVTVGTVKKHLNNIYGKLGVASRTQAIARGRELGLLTD